MRGRESENHRERGWVSEASPGAAASLQYFPSRRAAELHNSTAASGLRRFRAVLTGEQPFNGLIELAGNSQQDRGPDLALSSL